MDTSTPYLLADQYLTSNNKSYFAILQSDGHLCVYNGPSPSSARGGRWCDGGQVSTGVPHYMQLKNTGLLVIYEGTPASPGKQLWSSGREGAIGTYTLIMQDDSYLCIKFSNGTTIWCAGW